METSNWERAISQSVKMLLFHIDTLLQCEKLLGLASQRKHQKE